MILCIFLVIVSGLVYSFSNDTNNKDDYISNLIDSYKDIIIKKDIEINSLNKNLTYYKNYSNIIHTKYNLLVSQYYNLKEYKEIKTNFNFYKYYVKKFERYNREDLKKYSRNYNNYKEINEKAISLKGNDVEETVWNIYNFVYLEYSYSFNSKGILETFQTKKGDCTDSSELAVYMLRVNGIYSKTIHNGYCGEKKHDWVSILYPNDDLRKVNWLGFDVLDCNELVKFGDGIW